MDTPESQSTPEKKGFGRELWEFLKIIVLAALIVIPIRYFIAQPFIVKGASMEPNFEERDYLIVDELSYYFRSPERGEVVVFRFPLNPSEYFIKRVIGLPGETVVVSDGKVFIMKGPDGTPQQVPESYLPSGLVTSGDMKETLGSNEYFVLGDNRTASLDSRRWGPLPKENITGRVLFRAWPLSSAGVIILPHY